MSLLSARDCFLNAVLFIVCFLFFFLSYWMTNTLYQIMWKKNVYIHQIIIVQITYHFLNFRDGNHTRICVIDIRTRFFFWTNIHFIDTFTVNCDDAFVFFFDSFVCCCCFIRIGHKLTHTKIQTPTTQWPLTQLDECACERQCAQHFIVCCQFLAHNLHFSHAQFFKCHAVFTSAVNTN